MELDIVAAVLVGGLLGFWIRGITEYGQHWWRTHHHHF